MKISASPARTQLELFIGQAVAAAKEQNTVLDECRRFMFDGRDGLTFTLEMTVCDVHMAWDQGVERAHQWEARYAELARPFAEQLSKLDSRDRKARKPIKEEMARLAILGSFGHQMHGESYEAAQAALEELVMARWNSRKPKPDEAAIEAAHTDFWGSVSERHCLEETWLWTLADCADVAMAAVTAQTDDLTDSPEFREAYLRARTRGHASRVQLTRAETYQEHHTQKPCLITRIAKQS